MRVLLGVSLGCIACGGSSAPFEAAEEIVTFDLEQHPVEFLDVLDEVQSARAQAVPVGDLARRVELLEVLGLGRLRLRSDRGVEVVRLHGLGEVDPRLPHDVVQAMEGEWLQAWSRWLSEPGIELFEVRHGSLLGRGPGVGPPLPRDGSFRWASLVRVSSKGLRVDLAEDLLGRGWIYPEHPYGDSLSMDPRAVFADGDFAPNLHGARVAREEFVREAREVAAMHRLDLQSLGEAIHRDMAAWLGWQPELVPRFEALTQEQAEPVFEGFVKTDRRALEDWVTALAAKMRAEAEAEGGPVEVSVDFDLPGLPETVAQMLERLNGYSPAGPRIFVLRKPELSLRMLEDVLVHEIAHQYQEELLSEEHDYYPPPGTPSELGEAHAELLSARYRFERRRGYERIAALDYRDTTEHLAGLLEETPMASTAGESPTGGTGTFGIVSGSRRSGCRSSCSSKRGALSTRAWPSRQSPAQVCPARRDRWSGSRTFARKRCAHSSTGSGSGAWATRGREPSS